MRRHPILTFLRLTSNYLAYCAALIMACFTVRRWIFLAAAWPADRPTAVTTKTETMGPTVLLLAPFRDEAIVLPMLLRHLGRLDFPADQLMIVLIDDGSTDDSPQQAQTWCAGQPRRQLLRLPRTVGKAAALNAALADFAYGDLVAVFDADERPSASTLYQLAACFADERLGSASGRRVVNNPLASRIASVNTFENLVHQLVTMRAKERLALAPASLGSNCVYRRGALQAVGGFLPGALLEDSDLSLKLVAAGWRTRFIPDAISAHAVPQTLRGHWRQHRRWSGGFRQVARQQAMQIIGQRQLPWRLRLELLAFAMGYADRLAWLLLGLWLGGKTVLTRRLPRVSLAVFSTSLITPLLQVMVALHHAQAPAALWRRVLLLPFMLPLDMAIGLIGILRIKVSWEAREPSVGSEAGR